MTRSDDPKRAARLQAMEARARAAASSPDAAADLAKRFLALVPLASGATVAGFWPIGTEIDVRDLLGRLAAADHPCCLPVVVAPGRPLKFRAWSPGAPLVAGPHGTREPRSDRPELRPDVVVVPLLAFDRRGHRLGYGGGFYDRTIHALREAGPVLTVGVGYAAQEVAMLPDGPYDMRLDMIVTERYALAIADPPPGPEPARSQPESS